MKRSLRNIVCCLLAVTMLIPTSIALAAGSGEDVGGGGISYTVSNNTNGTSNGGSSTGTIDFNGGIKVSFMITSTDGESYYKPEENTMIPLLANKTPTGLIASSKVPQGYTDGENLGYFAVGSVYVTKSNNSTKGEAGIYTDGKGSFSFKWDKTAVSNKKVTAEDFQKAYKEINSKYGYKLSQSPVNKGEDLFTALSPNSTFKMMNSYDSSFLNFGMKLYTTNEEFLNHPTEVSHNKAVLGTLMQVMINKYGSTSSVGKLIQECGLETLADIDNSDYKFCILIEPALVIDKSSVNYFVTANSYLAGSLCETSGDFESFPRTAENLSIAMKFMGNSCNVSTRAKNGLNLGYKYFIGQRYGSNATKVNGRIESTSDNPSEKKPENLVSRVYYKGWFSWNKKLELTKTKGFITGSYKSEDYKHGWGTLACEDYMEMNGNNAVMSSTSLSVVNGGESNSPVINMGVFGESASEQVTNSYLKEIYEALDSILEQINGSSSSGSSEANEEWVNKMNSFAADRLTNILISIGAATGGLNEYDKVTDEQRNAKYNSIVSALSTGLKVEEIEDKDGNKVITLNTPENVELAKYLYLYSMTSKGEEVATSFSTEIKNYKKSGGTKYLKVKIENGDREQICDQILGGAGVDVFSSNESKAIINYTQKDIELGENEILEGIEMSANVTGISDLIKAGLDGYFDYIFM